MVLWSGPSVGGDPGRPRKTQFCSARWPPQIILRKSSGALRLNCCKTSGDLQFQVSEIRVWGLGTKHPVSAITAPKMAITQEGAGWLKVPTSPLVSLHCRFALPRYSNSSLLLPLMNPASEAFVQLVVVWPRRKWAHNYLFRWSTNLKVIALSLSRMKNFSIF